MSTTFQAPGIDKMSIEERLSLLQEIWESLEAVQEQVPLTEEQKAELDRRLAAQEKDPQAVIPWEQIKAQAFARFPE